MVSSPCLASSDELAVTNHSTVFFRLDAGGTNALYTIGALLHYAAAAHSHVGVAQ